MTETREGREQNQPIDLSEDFINMDDSTFAEKINRLGDQQINIRIEVELLGAEVFKKRLGRFLVGSSKRKAVIVSSQKNHDTFSKQFNAQYPGIEWEII